MGLLKSIRAVDKRVGRDLNMFKFRCTLVHGRSRVRNIIQRVHPSSAQQYSTE